MHNAVLAKSLVLPHTFVSSPQMYVFGRYLTSFRTVRPINGEPSLAIIATTIQCCHLTLLCDGRRVPNEFVHGMHYTERAFTLTIANAPKTTMLLCDESHIRYCLVGHLAERKKRPGERVWSVRFISTKVNSTQNCQPISVHIIFSSSLSALFWVVQCARSLLLVPWPRCM